MRAFASAVCVLMLLIAAVSAQQQRAPAPPKLPPLSYTCVHHPDVLEIGRARARSARWPSCRCDSTRRGCVRSTRQ